MYRVLIALAASMLLLGTGILGYGLYITLRPAPTCTADGTGCGAPPLTPRD